MTRSLSRIGFLAAFILIFSAFASPAQALTYTKNSFPTSSGQVITCDGNDLRISCEDSGDGRNHFCSTFGINGCRAVEGRNNFGSPGCLITCQKEDRCSDGTPSGQCSATNPFYCDAGILVKRASFCGCVSPKIRSGDDCVEQPSKAQQQPQAQQPQACSDNTPFNQCSSSRPLFCLGGSLINRALTCGCPSGQAPSGDNCVPIQTQQQTCTDGTLFGQCSPTRPLFCNNGVLINRATTCGCPSGQAASGDVCVLTVPPAVPAQVSNKLSITDIDAKVDGKKSSNIKNNGEISKEAKPDSDIELEIEVKNTFTSAEDIDIEDIAVRAVIESIGNEGDIEEEAESFDLRADSDKTVRFKFKVPLNAEEGTYNVFIEAEGEDENGTTHKDDADIELEVEKEQHDLRFLSFELFPKTVSCSRELNANVRITNLGKEDEENAFIEIKSDDLQLNFRNPISIKSDTGDNSAAKNLRFAIGNSVREGTYSFSANAISEDGAIRDRRSTDITVENCGAGLQQQGDGVILQISGPPQAKKEQVIAPLSGFSGLDPRIAVLLLAILIIILFILIIIFAVASGKETDEEQYY